ncbi:MAG: hypothetical protein IPK84_04340 [Candidatus Moraniibacteriota bacterium]|nr:MAG: hypothetical protein IPK84_04340 [Candidatus Moranbacteria bacterium]
MFHLLRLAIWVVGAAVVGSFLLNFFHYQIDWSYVRESRNRCFGAALECQQDIAKNGSGNARCKVACFEFSKLVEKQ